MFFEISIYQGHDYSYIAECSGDIDIQCEGISASDALECLLEEIKATEQRKDLKNVE